MWRLTHKAVRAQLPLAARLLSTAAPVRAAPKPGASPSSGSPEGGQEDVSTPVVVGLDSGGRTMYADPLETHGKTYLSDREQGLPDFIHAWNPDLFRKLGYILGGATVATIPFAIDFGLGLPMLLNPLITPLIGALTLGYWKLGLGDLDQKHHALRQNYPVLIHFRYIMESIRPEIRQYFVEDDHYQGPFSRNMRSVIYQRAKGMNDTTALGTKRNVNDEGYEWIGHTMFPLDHAEVKDRVMVGGPDCKQKYSASILNVSAMSYGALSGQAIEALNRGAKEGGFYHNTGEGGISKFHLTGADVVWNIGTGYFACGNSDGPGGSRQFDPEQFAQNAGRPEVKMVEIKLSQGAKPAHGGLLPASKITADIAEARGLGAPPYVDCNSPARHSAFTSPKGLMLFVQKLRTLSKGKPVGFKLCIGQPAEFAALIHAMLDTGVFPDFITVDGGEGGTGAAPREFQDRVGMPIRESLPFVHSMLTGAGVRDKITLISSGKAYDGYSLVHHMTSGADICNSARGMMFALGCIQALQCNSNNCPTGITTQKPELSSSLDVDEKSTRVANYQKATVHAAVELLAAVGCTTARELSPDLIRVRRQYTGGSRPMEHLPLPMEPGILLELEGDSWMSDLVAPDQLDSWKKGKAMYARTKDGTGHLTV